MFIAVSDYLTKIKNIADMAKELKLSIYIWGERGVGKTFLANYISSNSLIIEDFDKNPFISTHQKFIIATGSKPLNKELLKKYFSMDIELKPLKEHKEDIKPFIDYFSQEAKENLKITKDIKIDNPDISENLNSLKRQIYKEFLKPSKDEIYELLKEELLKNHSTYEEERNKFEKILFSAMRVKYKSKLQIANHLKINRVTLTKKMKALDV
ncbi:MAG: Fis family transcriptional regulator [Nautiliaceae bacterium]